MHVPKIWRKGEQGESQELADPPENSADLDDENALSTSPADHSADAGAAVPPASLGDGNPSSRDPGSTVQGCRAVSDKPTAAAGRPRDLGGSTSAGSPSEHMDLVPDDYRKHSWGDNLGRVSAPYRGGETTAPEAQEQPGLREAPAVREQSEVGEPRVDREGPVAGEQPVVRHAPIVRERPEVREQLEVGEPRVDRQAQVAGAHPGAQTQIAPPREPEPRRRDLIQMSSQFGADVAEETSVAGALPAARIAPPVVLVGKPRLGSNPGRLSAELDAAPDSVLDGARYPGIVVRAASLRGDDHRHDGETRQDSVGLWALAVPPGPDKDQLAILACVADGVGSYPLSHLGSARACWLLRQHVGAHLAKMVGSSTDDQARACRQIIDEVGAGLRVLAAERGLAPKEVSTTLAAVVVVPTRQDQPGAAAHAILFGVGDSKSFLLRDKAWTSVPEDADENGDVISTRTNALPTRPETCQVTMRELYEGDMLMLCTDGLAKPLALNQSIRDQLADWWDEQPPALPEFYWQLSFRAQTYGDDRSAICVWLNGHK